MQPARGYYLGKEIKKDSGIVTTSDASDSPQKYEIVAVGEPVLVDGENTFIEADYKKGDIVYIILHATANTPVEIKNKGLALFEFNRVMGKVAEDA